MDRLSRLRFLFTKYLQRQCSPGEVEELVFLLQQADAEEALSEEMELLWEEIRKDKVQYEVDWDKMYSSVVNTEKETDTIINRATSKTRWPYFAIAAVFIFLLSLPVYLLTRHSSSPKITRQDPVTVKVTYKKKIQHQTIHLPDGSTVILNKESKLNYPSAFGTKHRDVYLTGEGFFDIKHMPSRPFLVHTGKITIKVLGTAFNIKSYVNNVEVTVTRGKVQVLKEDTVLGVLSASQQISFNNQSGNVITKIVDTLPVVAWKPAEIFFNDITMQQAAEQMEERFNIKISFANAAVKNCRVTATFSEDDLPDEILAVICAVSKSDFKVIDGSFVIDGKGCN
jgi:ferric-dicitrate binding protein FerR (iron transport regulator)